MNRELYRKLAAAGVKDRLRELQVEVNDLFKEFPEQFATQTAPQIIRIAAKAGTALQLPKATKRRTRSTTWAG